MSLRVGIVGARRVRQGTGPFVARAFDTAGCTVAAIAGTSESSVAAAQTELAKAYGLKCRGHVGLTAMLAREDLDAIAICSPAAYHLPALKLALEAGVHVLCEKPLWWPPEATLCAGVDGEAVAALAEAFVGKGKLLALQAQWPYTLRFYERLFPALAGLEGADVRSFSMRLSPTCADVPDMVAESGSHLLSMLQALVGCGDIEALRTEALGAEVAEDSESQGAPGIRLRFAYVHGSGAVNTTFTLRQVPRQPRPAWYGVNGCIAERWIELSSYRMELRAGERRVAIGDPLDLCVEDFVRKIKEGAVDESRALVEHMTHLQALVEAVGG